MERCSYLFDKPWVVARRGYAAQCQRQEDHAGGHIWQENRENDWQEYQGYFDAECDELMRDAVEVGA